MELDDFQLQRLQRVNDWQQPRYYRQGKTLAEPRKEATLATVPRSNRPYCIVRSGSMLFSDWRRLVCRSLPKKGCERCE